MNKLRKHVTSALLTAAIAACVLFGSTQQSRAQYYANYYTYYAIYLSYFSSTGYAPYYYDALAYAYYYFAGYYGDLYAYDFDSFGYKSRHYKGTHSNWAFYYETYAANGDYYAHL
jgi:hypothetical protein